MLSGDIDCWTLLLTSSRHLLLTVFRVSGGRGGIGIGSLCIIGLFPGYFSWCTCEREHVCVIGWGGWLGV